MELKKYQKQVLSDLVRYMELLEETQNIDKAYTAFWNEKSVLVGFGGVPPYQNIIPGVPDLCMKVPTGGGKTYLACNAVKPIFDHLPVNKVKAVVWLVPSDSILTQTLHALRDTDHPYRQKLDADFGGRVEVYTKEELLSGTNFNASSIREQLSIMVLSYDSFRGRKEALKSKQENSNLAPLARALGTPEFPIEDADETALIQVINQLSPLVIVDESHHARSKLSKEMLRNFNPCFVLDLTATPTPESNVLCYVDAVLLKRENMVKLPVIVYNRDSQNEVLADACDLRARLEEEAREEQKQSGLYVRPIVLFQAQPKGKEDSTTFQKLKDKLVEAGIPAEQIAIKTADINELKDVDLMSDKCEIRYIITINALKEGWDCPFAYILASLANKTSQVDVEQILGRVLRQPYTHRFQTAALNMSYVLTSSNDFKATLENVVRGLNGAGFSDKDYRVGAAEENAQVMEQSPVAKPVLPAVPDQTYDYMPQEENTGTSAVHEAPAEEFLDFDTEKLSRDLNEQKNSENKAAPAIDHLLNHAELIQQQYNQSMEQAAETAEKIGVSSEVQDKMNLFHVNSEFEEEIRELRIPQFFIKVEDSLFQNDDDLLQKENLSEDFTLNGKPYDISFEQADDQMAKIDVSDKEGSLPKVFQMSERDQRYIKEQFSKYTPEQRVKTCKDIIYKSLDRMNEVDATELKEYTDRIVDKMDGNTLKQLENAPLGFAARIKAYIDKLMEEHYEKEFNHMLETGKIFCKPNYQFPDTIGPLHSTSTFGRSLYQAEEEANGFEYEMVLKLTGMENIEWWHRNISRHGFCINGFINHYPDFIVRTKSGKIIVIETKGDHLENTDTRQKLALGRAWQNASGGQFRYYMVFQDKNLHIPGAYPFDEFLALLKEL